MRGMGTVQAIVSTAVVPNPPLNLGTVFNLPATLAYKVYPWKVSDLIDGPSLVIDVLAWGLLLYLVTK